MNINGLHGICLKRQRLKSAVRLLVARRPTHIERLSVKAKYDIGVMIPISPMTE